MDRIGLVALGDGYWIEGDAIALRLSSFAGRDVPKEQQKKGLESKIPRNAHASFDGSISPPGRRDPGRVSRG